MDIDLFKVIRYSKDSLQNRALMRSIMLDLYPDKTREMNVLLDVYESGVPRQIIKDRTINDSKYAQYVQKIVDDYGMQERWAVFGLNAWIDVCLGKGESAKITYKASAESVSEGNVANGNLAGGYYTNPIVHTNVTPIMSAPVHGDVSEYEITDLGNGTIEIKKFVGFDQADMVIPTEIDGKKVVGIGRDAFRQCKGIERLIVPEGIEYISEGAFADCEKLSDVILPTSLKQLGKKDVSSRARWDCNGAFQGTAIAKIDLPNGITTIEDNSFKDCNKLVQILFPDNLRIIKKWAFSSCGSLTEVILPSKVEVLGYGAFSFCKQLSKVILNEGLKKIGDSVFCYNPPLTYLSIPRSVTEFGGDIINNNATIGCYPGSKAIEYARMHNLNMIDLTK